MEHLDYDVVIIGAGVIGCAIARELSRYELTVAVLEKEEDVCSGTSKANSGIVHAGFDAMPGTKKARFNREGNERMEQLSEELEFDFIRNGSLVVCFQEEDRPILQQLYERGIANGIPSLQILEKKEVLQLEPNLSEMVVAALYAPTGGIVCPFGLTIALAENACTNGVHFFFEQQVIKISKVGQEYEIITPTSNIHANYVVNAAGVHADELHNMVSQNKISIVPRRGEYCLLDHEVGAFVTHTIFQLPSNVGKGVLVTPTVHNNLLIGPNAVVIEEKEDTSTTVLGIEEVLRKAKSSVKTIPEWQIITTFAGVRAHEVRNDFLIKEVEDAKGFIDVAGIESPGLTAAPAIGEYVAGMITTAMMAKEKESFQPHRSDFIRPGRLSLKEREKLIHQKPEYGQIVCRCEQITEGEIIEAIHRKPGAVSMDGIKRRVRTGMGRCQGGFCTPRVMEILARETNRPIEEICKNHEGSNLLLHS